MTPRIGDWIQTRSGKKFYPYDAHEEDICIEDIAYGLREPRFASHTKGDLLYTVAQHSVLCSQIVPPEHALAALLHDAHEAYLKDFPSPVKRTPWMREYRQKCEELQWVINAWAGLEVDAHLHEAVKHADLVALATEARDLMGPPPAPWLPMPEPLAEVVEAWHPSWAARRFIERFNELRMASP